MSPASESARVERGARCRALVLNPVAGGRLGPATVEAVIRALGPGIEVLRTKGPRHAGELAADFARGAGAGGAEIIVLGGDGTLNETVTGLFDAGLLGGERGPVVGVVPGGTTNVVAKDLGLPRNPVAAARAVAAGRVRAVDLGLARIGGTTRPFVLALGAGLDAEAISRMHRSLKRTAGKAAYWLAGFRSAGAEWGIEVDFEGPAGAERGVPAATAIVGNARIYGGLVRLAAASRHDDGLLELVLVPSNRLPFLLWFGLRAGLSTAEAVRGVRVVPVTRVAVRSRRTAPVHVDAEVAGTTPVEVSVLPRALLLRAP